MVPWIVFSIISCMGKQYEHTHEQKKNNESTGEKNSCSDITTKIYRLMPVGRLDKHPKNPFFL